MKYYSIISYIFKGGQGAISMTHNKKYDTKTSLDKLAEDIINTFDNKTPSKIIITNIITVKNK